MIGQLVRRCVARIREIPNRGLPKLHAHRDSFDDEHGTVTNGIVWWTNPSSENYSHGIRYEPCSPTACRWAIEQIRDHKERVFIDVGCGKGRPLLIAAEYPFQQLIGVEYSERLCEIARKNLGNRATIICSDAASFQFPRAPLFLYFHNPFDSTVMSAVLRNLQGHQFYIAWEGQVSDCIDLRKVAESHNVQLFRSV